MGFRNPLGLFSRYCAALSAAWNLRHELTPPPRRRDELDFLPAALSIQETPVHPAPRYAALCIGLAFLTGIAWASIGNVDIVAVAPGRIVVSDRTKQIQPLERSVVRRVLVSDGQAVKAGQPLVELDPTSAAADTASIDEQLKSATSDYWRSRVLQKAVNGTHMASLADTAMESELIGLLPSSWAPSDRDSARAQIAAEWADIHAKFAKLQADVSLREAEIVTARELVEKLETVLPLASKREKDTRELAQQGFMSHQTLEDRTRERIELEKDLLAQRARLQEAVANLAESERSRDSFVAETRRALFERESSADEKRQQLSQQRLKAAFREKLTTLVAPVDGTVQQLAVHTNGGVVTEAQVLMILVPSTADVSAEVAIDNQDIGFVRPDQDAVIKVESFTYTRYGTIPGRVAIVSADAATDEKRGAVFPATIRLTQKQILVDGRMVRLSPGMNVTAEIRTGNQRIIDYLLSPLHRAASESMRER